MKKITFLALALGSIAASAQVKSTGTVNLSTNVKAKMDLDSATSTVTLTLSGPNDRWFALQFGSFDGGMEDGADLVYWNNTTLVDASHNGVGSPPSVDGTNNWTVVSNTNNTPASGQRTIVATRPFTGDAGDYTFNFNNANIDLAWARAASAVYTLQYHQGTNRGVFLNQGLTLGTEEFTLRSSLVYPNPAKGWFTVKTNTALEKINIYTQTGSFVKTVDVNALEGSEVRVDNLATGIYLLELVNPSDKAWKKLIVE